MKHDVPRVMHLLPHMGGGVGSVVRALLYRERHADEAGFAHSVVALESLNLPSRSFLEEQHIPWVEKADREAISRLIDNVDIVLVHWWNHPLLMRVLYEGLPPCRLAFWSHVNGYHVPQSFFPALFDLPDRFVFTTSASIQAPVVQRLSETLKQRLRVIRSCAGIPQGAECLVDKSAPFQAGYLGTVEPAKMHRDFLELCVKARLPTPCIVAGGPAHEELRESARQKGVAQHFDILGPVTDARQVFRRLHAFAYPLEPHHYGTGEQVLIEAMAYGAVPVVFANPPEQALIRHGETGIVAHTPDEFSAALHHLATDPAYRQKLADAGHRFVMNECHIDISVRLFHALFSELLSCTKKARALVLEPIEHVRAGSPFHLFLSSCTGHSEQDIALNLLTRGQEGFSIPASFRYATRGAPAHYARLLPPDADLERLCRICGIGIPSSSQETIMDDHPQFLAERRRRVAEYHRNLSLQQASESFLVESIKSHYSYNFDWMGLPIIQYPQDLVALQEVIWETRPDCIVETGVARGGSLVFYASMLELMGGDGFVVGIDIDIRAHNRRRLQEHPLMRRLRLIDGSSVSADIVRVVENIISDRKRVMVCLDSNHTHDHVFQELQKYAPLVTPGCYCVVFDTIVEDMPAGFFTDRPWDKGNNPRTAVSAYLQYLKTTSPNDRHGCAVQFEVDHAIDARLLVSAARGGWLRRRVQG